MNLPNLDVFKRATMKVLFNVGLFPSLGEEPGKFFDSVLGVFMTGLMADARVESDVVFVVIDVMPPMATSVRAMHQGNSLVDFHHIDSIAYVKGTSQWVDTMNHDGNIKFLHSQHEQILEAAAARH